MAKQPSYEELEQRVRELDADRIERRRAEAQLQQQAQELKILNTFGQKVLASLSLDWVVKAALEGVVEAMAPDLTLIFLRQGETLKLQGSHAGSPQYAHTETPVHCVGQCLCGLAVSLGQPLYSQDIHHDQRCIWEECKRANLRSFAALPLRDRNGAIGLLGLASGTKRDYQQQARFLETLADEVSIGIQNARLHQETQELAAFHQSVIERLVEGIALQDTAGTFTFVNPAAAGMLDAPPEGILGKHWTEVTPPDQHAKVQAADARRLQGKTDRYELEIEARNGRRRTVLVSGSPRFDREGSFAGTMAVFTDITDWKKAEEEREQLHKQLHRAQRMEAIGTLAGGIAHDFNNILGAIIGYTDLAVATTQDNEQIRYYLDQVQAAGYRARDLVKQILVFSRQTDREQDSIHITPIVKEASKLLRASIPSTIEIQTELTAAWDTVLADAGQIHQLVMNLSTNAAQAMQKHGGILSIKLADVQVDGALAETVPGLQEGPYLRLEFQDTGEGMPQALLERIFDPFFTTKKREEGTGLGLAVVHGIVQDHGGAISVESEPEQGTVFLVYLPRQDTAASVREQKKAPSLPGRGERILFVDDEPALVHIGRETLVGLGYEVTSCTSSLEALDIFQSRPDAFDMLITDLTMPNMTGLELIEEIHRIRPNLPVLLCSGFSDQISPEKTRSRGITLFLNKPLITGDLAEAIRKGLD